MLQRRCRIMPEHLVTTLMVDPVRQISLAADNPRFRAGFGKRYASPLTDTIDGCAKA
ncbi:MAG: hypothetical protein GY748_16560 [Planctomycetaceae bacterium]|nr:hypothetical protein [Planctomycetaceae bacterium]